MTNENSHEISELPPPAPVPERADAPELPPRLIGFATLTVLAAAGVITAWYITLPTPNLNLQSFGQIKTGMSVSDVNGIFGMRGENGPCGDGECPWIWRQGDNYALVSFGQVDGKARGGYFLTPDGKQHWLPRED